MTVLLDSYCWFEYFFGTPVGKKVEAIFSSGEEVTVSSVNVFEVYRKYLQNRPGEAAEKKLFMATRAKVLTLSEQTACLAAELSVKHGLHATDALVYASAVEKGAVLVTGDAHFKGMPSVKLV